MFLSPTSDKSVGHEAVREVYTTSPHDSGRLGRVAKVTGDKLVPAKFPCSKLFDWVLGSFAIERPGGGSGLSDYARGVGRLCGHNLEPRQKPGEAFRKEKSAWEP